MNNTLKDVFSKQNWESEDVKSLLFTESELKNHSPRIEQIWSRAAVYFREHLNEFNEEDFPLVLELRERFYESLKKTECFDLYRSKLSGLENIINSILFKTSTPPPLANADTINHSFDQVVKYLPNNSEIVNRSVGRKEEIQKLVNLLEKGDWDGIVLCYQINSWNFLAYDALGAFEQEKITMEQFSTLIFRWSVEQDFFESKIEAVPLFNPDGTINELAKGYIHQTLQTNNNRLNSISDENLENFYLRMKRAPKSERYFFQILGNFPAFDDRFFTSNKNRIITKAIQNVHVNIFNEFTPYDRKTAARMVASLSMMQQMLIAFQGENAVKITPVIGLSSEEDILNNGLFGTRDMALPFPSAIDFPKTADLLLAPKDWDFWNHDFYHAFVASQVPDAMRKRFIEFAMIMKETLSSIEGHPQISIFFNSFIERLIDMEGAVYREKNLDEVFAFLKIIPEYFRNTFKNLSQNPLFTKDISGFLKVLHPFFEQFIRDLNKKDFFKQLGVNASHLERVKERFADEINSAQDNPSLMRDLSMNTEFFFSFFPLFEL